jgi:uncharacterized SAM-binding protein YcdF (DUF218 family)
MEVIRMEANSTMEESALIATELKRLRVRRILAVTSDFHTRRAGKILRHAVGSEVSIRTVCAPTQHFDPSSWWTNREGRKIVFLEWTKSVATVLGL